MKKITLSTAFVVTFSFLYAQIPITKAAIIGKWQLESIEASNSFYYNFANDSIFIPTKPPATSPEAEVNRLIRQAELEKNIKSSLQNAFIKDGKRILLIFTKTDSIFTGYKETSTSGHITLDSTKASYKIDETSSTLTMYYYVAKVAPANTTIEAKAFFTKENLLVCEIMQQGILMKMEYSKLE